MGPDFRRGLLEPELRTAGAGALRALVALVHLSATGTLALDPTAVAPPAAHLPRHHDATRMQVREGGSVAQAVLAPQCIAV